MTNQTIQLAAAQTDGRPFRQRGFIGDINNRTGFTTADINQQTGRTLHGFVLQRRINTTLIAMGSIRVQTMTTRAASDGQRAKERGFQQNVLCFAVHARMFTTKNAAHSQRFIVVSNHQRVGCQFGFATVEQYQRFVLFRHTYDDTAVDTI